MALTGEDGLAVRRKRRPGPEELISAEDRGTLFTAMADHTPEELLIGGPLWTRAAVVELVRMVVRVVMTEQGVGLWLRRHGFIPQRPARRAYEQQPAAVRDGWTRSTRRSKRGEGRGCGYRMGRPVRAALRHRPVGPLMGAEGTDTGGAGDRERLRVNGVSAVASCGALWFTVFLDRLARQAVGRCT